MAFPTKLLNPDEDLVVQMNPHWSVLAVPALTTVVILGGVIAIVVAFPKAPAWVGWLLAAAVVVPVLRLLVSYLKYRTTSFVVTNQRIVLRSGILARHGSEMSLVRVNDVQFDQSIWMRLLSKGTLHIDSGGEGGEAVVPEMAHPAAIQSLILRLAEERRSAVSLQANSPHWGESEHPDPQGGTAEGGIGFNDGLERGWDMDRTPAGGSPPVGKSPWRRGLGGQGSSAAREPGERISVAEQLEKLDALWRNGSLTRDEFESEKAKLLGRR